MTAGFGVKKSGSKVQRSWCLRGPEESLLKERKGLIYKSWRDKELSILVQIEAGLMSISPPGMRHLENKRMYLRTWSCILSEEPGFVSGQLVDGMFWEEGEDMGSVLTREWKDLEEVRWYQMVSSVQREEQKVRTSWEQMTGEDFNAEWTKGLEIGGLDA